MITPCDHTHTPPCRLFLTILAHVPPPPTAPTAPPAPAVPAHPNLPPASQSATIDPAAATIATAMAPAAPATQRNAPAKRKRAGEAETSAPAKKTAAAAASSSAAAAAPAGANNEKIHAMLLELAESEKVKGDNIRAGSYFKAARAVKEHPSELANGKEAKKIKGVGPKIADKIDELLSSGDLSRNRRGARTHVP